MTYTPGREARFEYLEDTIDHIEAHNCVLGCKVPDPKEVTADGFGAGGNCWVLAELFTEEPMEQLDDDGTVITCKERIPL